jgi:hypothetical protein
MKKVYWQLSSLFLLTACVFLTFNTSAQTLNATAQTGSSRQGFGFRVGLNYAKKVNGSNDSIQYR